MEREWVVLLEAAANGACGSMGEGDVARLLSALGGGDGVALQSAERYALQLTTTAASPAEALHGVMSRWSHLVGELGLPAWEMVRTEVFTPEELARELESIDGDDPVSPWASPSPFVSNHGLERENDLGRELLRRAFSDPLTGLLSREALEHRLEAALAGSGEQGLTAILCLALEGARIDDRYCGAIQDDVLLEAAQRMAAQLRPGDSLARFSDDGYAVLVENTTERAARALADRLLKTLGVRVKVRGHEVDLSASAGVALSQTGEDAQAVMDKAEAALSLARRSGGLHVLCQSPPSRRLPVSAIAPSQALRNRLVHSQLLLEASVAANEADTLQQAAGVVLGQMRAHVGCAIGHLWASPAAASEGLCSSVWNVSDVHDYTEFQAESEALLVRPGVGLPGCVLMSGAPLMIADLAADPEWLRRESSVAAGLASGFGFPVLVGREVVAVLECFSREPMEPSGSFLDVLSGIGTQLGRVVERQRAAAAMRRSQEQLQISEAGMRQAQALAGLGSWQFDLCSGEGSWSDEMYHHYGLDPSGPALSLETAIACVHPADRASVEAAVARAASGKRATTELRVVRPDGQLRWLRVEGMGILDDDGVVVAVHGTSQDITERKLMEEALRAREVQLTEAQRVARLGWWELDLATERLVWSQEMYPLCGMEPGEEVSVQRFFDMVHPEDRQRLLHNMARIRQPGEVFHVESPWVDYRAFTSDGRQRWFRARIQLLHDEQGSPVKLSGTMQDVTEEKLSEESLRSAKQLHQRILETAHEGILTLDAQGTTIFANARLAQMLGYAADELPGMPASEFMDSRTQAALFGHDQRRGTGLSEQHEARLRAKDGTFVEVLISASSLVDEEGHFDGTLAMITDVSALRQAEDVIRRQNLTGQAEGEHAPEGPFDP